MGNLTKWAFRIGSSALLLALIGGFCLAALDAISNDGSDGNREAPRVVVGILFVIFILCGFVVFVGAIRKLRESWHHFSPRTRFLTMGALIATNFFGGYVFFLAYDWIARREKIEPQGE
jgi:hypothetical protein